MDIKVTPFPYKERAATTLLFEVLNGQFALSVDRKCVELKSEVETINESGYIRLELQLAEPGLFAVDYVKVWEALPKNNDEK